jgi:hypothetical protein
MSAIGLACPCFSATEDIEMVREPDCSIPLADFIELRDRCLVLRDILLPDEIWPAFIEWHKKGDDEASHASVVLLAFRRGFLPKVTGPIHRYLMSSTGIRSTTSKQYVKDLRERWMFDPDPIERNCLSRIFRGRLIELQFAAWLESQSHEIAGMEAYRKGPDIETVSADGATSFEVKFFGVEDGDFRVLLRSMSGDGPAGGAVSLYEPVNYMLLRLYQAAMQLRGAGGRKTVVIVIDDTGWWRFKMQFRGNWIDWDNPKFIGLNECEWRPLLSLLKDPSPLPEALGSTIREVDSLRIYRQDSAFEFRLEKAVDYQ